MSDIDDFATQLLEEAKRFLEIASEKESQEGVDACLHAALMLAFSALEAHVNAVCAEFSLRPELSIHEKGVLLEQDVILTDGSYETGGLRIYRLEDRLAFLYKRFSGKSVDRQSSWWSDLSVASQLRNRLTHPKGAEKVTEKSIANAILAVIATVDALYLAIYKKPFPAAKRSLQSKLSF